MSSPEDAPLLQFAVFAGEAVVLALAMLALFRLRRVFGLSLLYIALGVMQPLQVRLASALYADLFPGIAISPGSAVLFTCSLFVVLLVYIREDANEARKLIYGLVVANVAVSALYAMTYFHLAMPGSLNVQALPRELFAQDARVMIAGTAALYVDAILLVIVYEAMRRTWIRSNLLLRVFTTFAIVLTFDSVAFAAGAFLGTPLFGTVLVSGLVGKLTFSLLYTAALVAYLVFVERDTDGPPKRLEPFRDIFHTLTYREKYELERAASERALRHSDARQRAILDAAADGIFALDENGAVIEANPAAVATLGLPRAEIIGKRFAETFLAPDSRAAFASLLGAPGAGARAGPSRVAAAVAVRGGGETFPAEFLVAPTEFEGSHSHIVSLRDVSERQRILEAFLQSQKLEALGRLAGGIAHDFNNLLTVILGEAETLERELEEAGQGRPRVRAISESAHRAARLTGQLLAFARRQVLQPSVVDLAATVRGLADLLRRLLGEDVRLEILGGPGLHPVLASPDQVEQVIVNLAVNARDAMPEGGTLTIETSNVDGRMHPALEPVPYALCAVRDTGRGMTEELASHAFEPFFTTKDAGRGTGLGLATCFGIVSQFGGHIEIESRVGAGTTVRFYLPRTDRVEGPRERAAASVAARGSERILVVEDDAGVRDIMAHALRGFGYDVRTAATAEEALEALERERLVVDLVVSDIVMPGLRGDRFVARLRQAGRPVRALFVSGYPRDAEFTEGADPATGFLQKPFTFQQLGRSVRRLLDAPAQDRPADASAPTRPRT